MPENENGSTPTTEQVLKDAARHSVTSLSRDGLFTFIPGGVPDIAPGIFIQMAQQADQIPDWNYLYPNWRDDRLKRMARSETMMAGAVYSMKARMQTLGFVVNGDNETTKQDALNLLNTAHYGKGLKHLTGLVMDDLLTTDNGAFIELYGPGRPDQPLGERKIVGIAHLDSRLCLGRDTRVLLSDGTKRAIIDIVRNRESVEVMALDDNGQLVPRKVIGWHESQLNGRHWLRITLKNPYRAYGRKEGLWLTNDHPVLTECGWKRADELTLSDRIVTQYDDMTELQAEMIVGTLLGDGSLTASTGVKESKFGLSFVHCPAQREWLELKRDALRGWHISPIVVNRNTNIVFTHKTPALIEWREMWYPNGKKQIPRGLVEDHFSPLMLATWYLDDGNIAFPNRKSPAAKFTANGYSQSDIEWLSALLKANGVDNTIQKKRIGQWDIYIKARHGNSKRFFEAIAPYVPPSMRYKLPANMPPFNPDLWDLGVAPRYADAIGSINTGTNGDQATAFCLDIEEHHNFVAAGMVVHNCWRTFNPEYPVLYTNPQTGQRHKIHHSRIRMISDNTQPIELARGMGYCAVSRALQWIKIIRDTLTFREEKVGGRFNRAIGAVSGVTKKQLDEALRQADEAADSAGFLVYKSIPFLVAPGMQSGTPISIQLQDLASIPDGFNFNDDMTLYAYVLALAFGVDAREFWPATTSGATKADAAVQNMKARGRGIGLNVTLLEDLWRDILSLVDDTLTFEYDYADDEQDRAVADIQAVKVQNLNTLKQAGALTAEMVQALAIAEGIIDGDVIKGMALPADDTDNLADQEKPDTGDLPEDDEEEPPPGDMEEKAREDSVAVLAHFSDTAPIEQVQAVLRGLLKGKPDYDQVEFNEPDTFHTTVAIADAGDLSGVQSVLPQRLKAFSVMVDGVGVFDTPDGYAVHLTVRPDGELLTTQKAVAKAIQKKGYTLTPFSNPENYKPHITLAYLPSSIEPFEIKPFALIVNRLSVNDDDHETMLDVSLKKKDLRTPGNATYESRTNDFQRQFQGIVENFIQQLPDQIDAELVYTATNRLQNQLLRELSDGLTEAFGVGLGGEQPTARGVERLTSIGTTQTGFIRGAFIPDLQTALIQASNSGAMGQDLKDAIAAFITRAGLYAGAYWNAVWLGVGDRTRRMDKPPRVRRVLDVQADHCETCPTKARIYDSFDDMVQQAGIPGDLSDLCGSNCRCMIEVELTPGQEDWSRLTESPTIFTTSLLRF